MTLSSEYRNKASGLVKGRGLADKPIKLLAYQ